MARTSNRKTHHAPVNGQKENLCDAIRRIFEPLGGFNLDIPRREDMRERLDFSGPEYGVYDDDPPSAPAKT